MLRQNLGLRLRLADLQSRFPLYRAGASQHAQLGAPLLAGITRPPWHPLLTRQGVQVKLETSAQTVDALIYVAAEDNHAYLGPAALEEVASHISRSSGPSGSNTDYVLQLAQALRQLGDHDPHVYALEALLSN